MDLDLRLVRYFTVVAEHGGLGKAAGALHVAQPALSRQMQRLEHQVGARLFERTPQGVSLTQAGQEFLPYAQTLLRTAERGLLAARTAPAGTIVIGHLGDLVITPAVRELRRLHPGALIRTRHLDWRELDALSEHRVDALVTRLPLPIPAPMVADRLRVTELYDEPRVAVLPVGHRLAAKDTIAVTDLVDEDLVACEHTPTIWGVSRNAAGPIVPPSAEDGYEDKLELVASGDAVAILPAGDRRIALRSEVVAVPVSGIEPCRVVAVTHADDDSVLADAFHRVLARTLRDPMGL
ncbi:LysR family transcriptional regulator [Catenulispora sp. NL8]|uniref:LysR family transcriptional regulator n=1 Tax=Catenulispora pinistramenti TaxID=2705254 RepID=A0ABS5KPX8_9ACTN|nr:LysR family transcriptional regulator [Catenulispora pinistramenti]MBS2548080.1 LysR family transcriptional regulator [Catenulispora pinistramenti]